MAATLAVGDILEFECRGGWCYLSYAGRDPTMGDAVWLVPKIYPTRRNDWESVFSNPDGFWLFYPAHATLRAKLVRKVGFSEHAVRLVPRVNRTIVAKDESGMVKSWYLSDGTNRVPKLDAELTDAERSLPVARIWNHAYLREQLELGRLERPSK